MQTAYLGAVAETVNSLPCSENMRRGEFLVILGDEGGREEDGFEKLTYIPYEYKGENFIPLT